MAYSKEELLALPANEKLALAEELWGSVENDLLPITEEDIAFAQERLKLHEDTAEEGLSIEELKKHLKNIYGF